MVIVCKHALVGGATVATVAVGAGELVGATATASLWSGVGTAGVGAGVSEQAAAITATNTRITAIKKFVRNAFTFLLLSRES